MFRFKVLHVATAAIGSSCGFLFGARQKNSFKVDACDPENLGNLSLTQEPCEPSLEQRFAEVAEENSCATSRSPEKNPCEIIPPAPIPCGPSLKERFSSVGEPISCQLIQNNDFLIMYDFRTLIASWVLEHLAENNLTEDPNNLERCYDGDNRVLSRNFIVNYNYYHNYVVPPCTKGHLAQLQNHRHSEESFQIANKLTNIAPQTESLNSVSWKWLEENVRDAISLLKMDFVLVLTAPFFMPGVEETTGRTMMKYEVVGENKLIAVPTHYLKIVSFRDKKSELGIVGHLIAVLPNINMTKDTVLDKSKFLNPGNLQEIENRVGFHLVNVIGPKTKKRKKKKNAESNNSLENSG